MQRHLLLPVLILLLVASIGQAEDKSYVTKAEDKTNTVHAQSPTLRIVSYNTENLFDCQHDSLKNDSDFLDGGFYHWTETRYREKMHHIAEVVCAIGGMEVPALVGLMEVENDHCLSDLCRYYLRPTLYPYRYIHFESPDSRGIDVALLYDTTRLMCLRAKAIRIPVTQTVKTTRDILYAEMKRRKQEEGETQSSQSIHCFVCHLPSQLGGAAATADRRQQVVNILQQHIDSLLRADHNAHILVMGDFNMLPEEHLLQGMVNLMMPYTQTSIGTHKYHREWTCLDQMFASPALHSHLQRPQIGDSLPADFITDSPALIFAPQWLLEEDDRYLGVRPFRTYIGPKYQKGFSDHLPVVLDIR